MAVIFGLLLAPVAWALAQELYVPPVGAGCEVDLSTGGCRESTANNPPIVPEIYGIEDEEIDSGTNVDNSSISEEPAEEPVGSGGIIGDEQAPPAPKKQVTPPPKKTVTPPPVQPKKQTTAEADSEALLDAVIATYNKQHKNEVAAIKQYYNKPPLFRPATNAEYAQNEMSQLRPLGVDVVNAKGDYEDALNKGAGRSEIANLKNS